MKAEETKFLNFLNSPKQLMIPIYQRAYSWKLKECKQLWSDILRAGLDDSISGHFMGSVVYVEKGIYQVSSLPKLLVIDGQQRLTTLTLLITALCNYLKETENTLNLNPNEFADYYLFNTYKKGDEKYKLALTRHDKVTLFKILDNLDLTDEDSNKVKENYDYFKSQITLENLETVYKGISKLIIVDISLDREKDNPQLIFESLNSTGLELSQADLIRNYILMDLEPSKQEEIYNNYWHLIEKNFGQSESNSLFDNYMRDYLTIKLGRIPTKGEVYSEFKNYVSDKSNIENVVADVYKLSKYYIRFALGKEEDFTLRYIFKDINDLKVDVSYPFILQVYQDYDEEKITKDVFIQILKTIESYVFRRAICGVQTNSLNKTFSTLYKKINHETYFESFLATMVLQDSYRRLPNDTEFTQELMNKDVYHFRNKNYLLRRIENDNRKEYVNVDSYTIEHIMPQNPNPSKEWKEALGENWKEIQKTYLHRIGNLTLTGYNSEYQDRPFLEKRDFKDKEGNSIGFRNSPIRLNESLAELETWNEEAIISRAKEIAKISLKIWKYPLVSKEILDKYKEDEIIEKHEYSIGDHKYLQEDAPMKPLFDLLDKQILNLDSSIKQEPKKLYIAYKVPMNFVDIIPKKGSLKLSLSIPISELKDPENKCKDVSEIGNWGTGATEVQISSESELEYAMDLIKQAFDYMLEY